MQVVLEEADGLVVDEWRVGLERLGREAVLDLRTLTQHASWQMLTNFFCCMSISFGQSYTTPLPKIGVVRCYPSAACRKAKHPLCKPPQQRPDWSCRQARDCCPWVRARQSSCDRA